MDSYTDEGIAHAELMLVTYLKRKTLWEIKTPSCQYILCRIPCCLQYLETMSKSVVCRGSGGGGGAIEHISSPPELSQDLTASPIWWFFKVHPLSQVALKNQANAPAYPSTHVVL
jgi:hypothetical protein